MGLSAHICTKHEIEYGKGFGNYSMDKVLVLFKKINSIENLEGFLEYYNDNIYLKEKTHDFVLDFKKFIELMEDKENKTFYDSLKDEEKEWLNTIYEDVKLHREYLSKKGYIRIEWF